MKRFPTLALLALLILTATPAQATTTETDLCARLEHWGSLTPNYYRLAPSDFPGSATCGSPPELIEGDCLTLYGGATYNGPPNAPTAPSRVMVYVFPADANPTHDSTGEANWDSYLQRWTWTNHADFNAAQVEYCATTTANSTGEPTRDPHRLVIRVCQTTGTGGGCGTGVRGYDVNSDGDGNPGTGYTIGNTVRGITNPKARSDDPLTITAPADVTTGAPVNITIHSEWDNRTARTGAADNITVDVIGPDNTTILSGVHPTETILPGGKLAGYYHFTFTPTLDGAYHVFANVTTSKNEARSAPAATVTAKPAPLTRDHFDAMLAGLNSTLATLATPADVTTARDAVNSHTDSATSALALEATVATRATPADVTAARDAINSHTDSATSPLALESTVAARATPADVTAARDAINAHTTSKTATLALESTAQGLSTPADVTNAQNAILAGLAPLALETTVQARATPADVTNARDAINAHTDSATSPLALEATVATRATPANITTARDLITARLNATTADVHGAVLSTTDALDLALHAHDTRANLHDTNQTRQTHDNARQFTTLHTATETTAARAQLYALATVGFVLLTGYLTRYRSKTRS